MTKAGRFALSAFILIGVAASLAPLVETNLWWIRYLDFVRLQGAAALAITLALYASLGGWRSVADRGVVALGIVALGLHAYRLYPYAGVVEAMAVATPACPAESRLKILVANIQWGNRRSEALFAIVARVKPDLFLVLETDEWWDAKLQDLGERFPDGIAHVPADAIYFGMHLLSRYPLVEPRIGFYFGADTPTVLTGVALPDGREALFIGLHPRPPQFWDQPTTMRDAHLLAAALEARGSERPSILAGDLNATPWEGVTRRAMRIGGLLDPRVGRGVYPTFDAQSWLMSWPLDQVLFQDSFGLAAWDVLPAFGSDHLPVMAELCLQPDLAARQSAPALLAGDVDAAQAALRAAKTMER